MAITYEYPVEILHDGDRRYKSLEINNVGDLIYEQTDAGKTTAILAPNGGDSDYEYWVTVKSNEVEKVLLGLVRDRFDNQRYFKSWLVDHKIEHKFFSY